MPDQSFGTARYVAATHVAAALMPEDFGRAEDVAPALGLQAGRAPR